MLALWRRLRGHLSLRERLSTLAASLVVATLVAFLSMWVPEPFEKLNEIFYRYCLTERNRHLTGADLARINSELALVCIDDETTAEYGWPLPRDMYQELVRRLKLAGITTVGLDILFEKKGPSPEADANLRAVLADPDVILPYRFDRQANQLERVFPHESLLPKGLAAARQSLQFGFTAVVGSANEVRTVWLKVNRGDQNYYAWPVVLLAHARQQTPDQILTGIRSFAELNYVDKLQVQTVEAWVNLPARGGDTDQVDRLTLSMILNEMSAKTLLEIPEKDLPNLFVDSHPQIALVGLTVTAGTESKETLVGSMTGPEIQACTLMNLMENSFLIPSSGFEELSYVVLMALLAGALAATLNFRSMLYGMTLLGLGVVAVNYYALASRGFRSAYLFPISSPMLALLLASFVVIVLHLVFERRRLEHIVAMFREVCPVHDLERLLTGQGLQLGGEEKELTILFSDLRGYTSFAEQMDSVTVLNTLNDYFGTVGHIFEQFGGFVFDYQGDAQMVVFGLVPASQPNHAAAACRAGAAMVAELNRRREEWLVAGQSVPETGVGICTGKVSFGVLGTAQHKQYVAIGDPTNTASRVQGKSAELDFSVLLTESTVVSAGGGIPVQPLEKLVLKGKREPLQVYGLKLEEMLAQLEVDRDGRLSWFFREEQ